MTEPVPTPVRRVVIALGLIAYIATGFLYLVSGLVVPLGWLILLLAIWLAGLWLTTLQVARWSWWALAGAPVALVVWWVYVTLGGALLGWTA